MKMQEAVAKVAMKFHRRIKRLGTRRGAVAARNTQLVLKRLADFRLRLSRFAMLSFRWALGWILE